MSEANDQRYELRDLLRMLWRGRWPLLLCAVLLPVATYLLTSRIKKTYAASAIVQVQGAEVDTSLFTPTQGLSQPQAIAATAKLVGTSQVGGPAARLLGLPASAIPALLNSISVSEDDTTGFVTITATARSPARSATVANAFAHAVVTLRSAQAQGQVNRTVAAVARRLAQLPASEATARSQLSDQLQRLRAVAAAQIGNAQVIKPATSPSAPASPKPLRDAILALVLGVLLGVGLAFLIDRLDRRIRTVDELEEITGLPLLGAIPEGAFGRQAPSGEASEAFQTLRTSLTYFNVDQPLKSLIVTSAGPGEGKTTVAMNLAVSFARGGRDVILLDTDLRRSSLLSLLGLDGWRGDGLGIVLADGVPLIEALFEVPTSGGRLRALPAGVPPPNPSELLSSARMTRLLKEAGEMADLVIIDSSPLLAVSDSVPLLSQVSGVLLLARLEQTTRDAMRRFQEIVRLAGGNVFGAVATGAPESEAYGYGYVQGHAEAPEAAIPPGVRDADAGESLPPPDQRRRRRSPVGEQ